jgi:uncharacterized protein (TIGR02757 family)
VGNGLKDRLEAIYARYNRREYVDPDPLLFLYDYPDKRDREIAALIAACFAYGRVEQIMKTVAHILGKFSGTPRAYIETQTKPDIADDFKGFRYRFASQAHLVNFLWGIRRVVDEFSSLENCFYSGSSTGDETLLPGLVFLTEQIGKQGEVGHLLADPKKKSACKRSLLFLRWMVRKDRVDPGGWDRIDPGGLIIPLDTHMHRIGHLLGFSRRRQADMRTALEITRGFRQISRHDPVKYDFCLTRFGIRREMSIEDLKRCVGKNCNRMAGV